MASPISNEAPQLDANIIDTDNVFNLSNDIPSGKMDFPSEYTTGGEGNGDERDQGALSGNKGEGESRPLSSGSQGLEQQGQKSFLEERSSADETEAKPSLPVEDSSKENQLSVVDGGEYEHVKVNEKESGEYQGDARAELESKPNGRSSSSLSSSSASLVSKASRTSSKSGHSQTDEVAAVSAEERGNGESAAPLDDGQVSPKTGGNSGSGVQEQLPSTTPDTVIKTQPEAQTEISTEPKAEKDTATGTAQNKAQQEETKEKTCFCF